MLARRNDASVQQCAVKIVGPDNGGHEQRTVAELIVRGSTCAPSYCIREMKIFQVVAERRVNAGDLAKENAKQAASRRSTRMVRFD